MAKETPAQRVERIKKQKSGLDVLEDIYRYAISGEDVDPEDIDRFKWYGLYTQNKAMQDENDDTQYFMLRVKLLQGALNIEQMRAIAGIAKEFAQSTVHFTTRQDVQFHFITVRDLPEIFYRLKSVSLTTTFAAGDVPRNVVSCPVSGVDHDEIYDVRDIVSEVNEYFDANKTLANLPRKYKVGISGCAKHCMNHEIQDLSFSAYKRSSGSVLFDVSVGGGLASNTKFAISIGSVLPSAILEVVHAVSAIYRDHGLRENRKKARLGHLIDEWGIEKFKAEVESAIGYSLSDTPRQEYTPHAQREHFGVHSSKEEGLCYIGCAVNGGCIGADGFFKLADILEAEGAQTIKATTTQNFIIIDVPANNSESIVEALSKIDIDARPNPFKARMLSCTGIRFCKFGLVETKGRAMELAEYLHEKFPHFDETVTISVNGCPNSCAHPKVADIGLVGTKFKDESGNIVAGFEVLLGGNLEGDKSKLGEKMKTKLTSDKVNSFVEGIIAKYLKSGCKCFGWFLKDLCVGEEFKSYKLKKNDR